MGIEGAIREEETNIEVLGIDFIVFWEVIVFLGHEYTL